MNGPLDHHAAEQRRPHMSRQHGITYSLNSSESSAFSHPTPSYPLPPYPTPWNGPISLNMEAIEGFRGPVGSSASVSNIVPTSSNNMSNLSQPYIPQPLNSILGPRNFNLGLQSDLAADTFGDMELLSEPQDLEEKSRRLAPRQSALNLPEWEEHRAEIKRLYIDEFNSLQKTREIMAKDFGFESSAQLYKTKLNEWGFTKYLPRSVAEWVLMKEKQRLQEGKTKTVYDYGGRRLNIAEVQRKAKRSKAQMPEPSVIDVETPNNLVYATPKTVTSSPFSPRLSPPLVVSQATPHPTRNWKPPPNSDISRPDLIKLTWNGYTRAQLESMHEDARNLACLEEFEKAEAKFCEALNGHEYLLSSVHKSTSTLAYDLANFYARRDRMHDAYAVLDWLIKEHLNNSDVGDEETAAHISRVIQLLHSWSRSEEAINLLTKTLVSCHKLAGSQDFAPPLNQMRPENENPSKKREIPEIPNFMPANPAAHFGDELSQLNCELKIAKSYSKAGKKEAESGDLYKLFAALKSAGDIFWNIIERQSGGPSILKTAIKLVHFYIQAELAPAAKPMLERIEREVARMLDEEDKEFVDLLLEYYEGILFLTTNRIQSFDKAFKSRIHLAIKYHPLVPSARAKLWELFIRNTYPDSNLEWMDAACLERFGNVKLNGREIKNAFRTGHALAVHSGEQFNLSHIEMALEGIQNFEADFDGAQDESASEDESQERGKKRRRRD